MIYSGLIKLIESPLFLGLMADAEDVDVTQLKASPVVNQMT